MTTERVLPEAAPGAAEAGNKTEKRMPATKMVVLILLGIIVLIGIIVGIIVGAGRRGDKAPALAPVSGSDQPFSLTILHVNDHHSHLEEENFNVDGVDANITLEEVQVNYGGFPRLVSTFLHLEGESENVLKLHAGDAITGTIYYTSFEGEADATMMNFVCFDAFALGNHEFDHGDEKLASFLGALQGSKDCPDTPVLSANLVPADDSPLKTLVDEGKLKGESVFTFEGEEIGVVGIDIRNKTMFSSSPSPGTTFEDEVSTATAEVEALTAAGVDKIVLLTHIGYDFDQDWMVNIPGVDIVVGGDSHSLLGGEEELAPVGFPQGPYPTTVTASDGRTVCVVTAWDYAHGVGKLEVEFDGEGAVTSCSGRTVIPFDPLITGDDVTVEDAAAVTEYLESLGFLAIAEDEEAASYLDSLSPKVEEFKTRVVATVPKDICFERIPGEGYSEICPPEATSAQGGGVCNLVAQGFLSQAFTADLFIQNGGGCRADITAGNFSIADAYTLLPFSNTLVTLDMTGAEIELVLEQALENALVGGDTGAYPYASGIRYDVDANKKLGKRLSNVEINSRLEGDWVPIEEDTVYSVATISFLASGGDGYLEFAKIDDGLVTDLHLEYAQSFIDYASSQGTLVDPPLDDYSTKSFVPLEEEALSAQGQQRTRRLSAPSSF